MENIQFKHFEQYIQLTIPFWITSIDIDQNIFKIKVNEKDLPHLIKFVKLHTNIKMEILTDVFAVDNISNLIRFCIYYQLLSIFFNFRLEIKCEISSNSDIITSVTNEYKSANWLEREVWDLMGIFFINHPDLRRILTDYGFNGFPLRKDFPLTGYEEIRYDDETQKIVSEPIQLAQEFRFFDFKNPWKNK